MANIVNCDFCGKEIEATTERECAWMGDIATNWICDECNATSDRLYAESDIMREIHESEIAESEPSDMMNFL